MKKSINVIQKIHTKGKYYDEDVILSNLVEDSQSQLLDILCFGHSLFKRGAEIRMFKCKWVMEFQISGKADIITPDEKYHLEPGDMLVVPPEISFLYRVPDSPNMTKYYMIFRLNPLLEILLGKEIRQNGMKVKLLDSTGMQRLLEEIREQLQKTGAASLERISILLYEVICKIRSSIHTTVQAGPFYRKLNNAINELMNQQITLEKLSNCFGIGKYSLIREFNKRTGMPPVAYMISMRHRYACQLLLLSDMSILEIAESCGYSSSAFFISDFKKHEGITPGQYRQQNKDK